MAEPIFADRDYPPFARSARDGFAVRSADLPGDLHVIGEVRAGQVFANTVGPHEAVEIMTGAPLPAGARLHPQGFGTCSEATLKNVGPAGCKPSSIASPVGNVLGEVTFGTERVPEEAELRAFFAPRGGLLFYTAGHSPVALEIVSSGHYVNSHQRPYGLKLITLVPPVASVPGAPLASVRRIKIKAGAAIKKGRSLISYGYMPRKCPKGGFPVKTEVTFGGSFGPGREFGIPAQTQTATYRAPCPKRHR